MKIIDSITKVAVATVIVLLTVLAIALIMSLPLYWLWNWLMPSIFSLREITWAEALGLMILSGLVFKSNVTKEN